MVSLTGADRFGFGYGINIFLLRDFNKQREANMIIVHNGSTIPLSAIFGHAMMISGR